MRAEVLKIVSPPRPRSTARRAWLPLLPASIFVMALFVLPVCYLLAASFTTKSGEPTLAYYLRLVSTPLYVDVLFGTFKTSLFTTAICLIGGYPVAYLLANRAGNKRGLLLLCVLMPFWTSVLVRCFAWMVILGRQGLVNHSLVASGVVERPLELMYGSAAVLIGMSHALMPLAILTMLSVMENIDHNLSRAAGTLGAQAGNRFWRVYFPLSQPGVVAAGLLVFVSSIGFFITPMLLGGPNDMMIVQVIVSQMDELLDWSFAGALAVLLLAASAVIFFIFDRLVGLSSLTGEIRTGVTPQAGRHEKVWITLLGGLGWGTIAVGAAIARCFRWLPEKIRNQAPRWPLWVVGLFMLLFLAGPSFVLVPVSISENPFIAWPPRGFTLDWYRAYFDSPVWQLATIRSFWIAFWTGILSLLLGVPAAFVLARHNVRGKPAIIAMLVAPMIMPHIIVAVGLFYLYAQIGLVGTTLGIVLGHTVLSLPYVTITILAVLRHYDLRFDQAAATLGARPLTIFRLVTLPIIKTGMITAFVFAFVKSFDELTVALFIAGGASTTLPRQIWTETLHNVTPTIAAASTILLVIIAIAIVISEWANRQRRTSSAR